MQDLRLVGVHDDGEHLLLSGPGGDISRLRIDEALRVAASRPPARSSAAAGQEEVARLSPRDIQMQIRAGATAEEVAESSGLALAHIQRYEGPVLAEREYIALQARNMEISAAVPSHDGYRSAFGDNAASLDEMVSYRLGTFGITPSSVVWDAWRRPDGTWTVSADFDANIAGAAASIGESAPAQWTYNPGRKTIRNANRWAQQLSELEPLDGALPARRLSAVADRPFDFEVDAPGTAGYAGAELATTELITAEQDRNEADSLLDMLRARRGQRLGLDEDDDDALATLLTSGVPAANPRGLPADSAFDAPTGAAPAGGEDTGQDAAQVAAHVGTDAPADAVTGAKAGGPSAAPRAAGPKDATASQSPEPHEQGGEQSAGPRGVRSMMFPALSLAPRRHHFTGDSPVDGIALHEVSTQTREIRIPAGPKSVQVATAHPQESTAEDDAASDPRHDRKPAVRPKRSSVPSWDEIVFGTKGD
jgi:hypothetical protein